MKTTIELPDPLFRRAKVLAAQRGATLRDLVVEGLQHVTGSGGAPGGVPFALTPEESTIATIGPRGLPVLKRAAGARKAKVTHALVDRLRDELSI